MEINKNGWFNQCNNEGLIDQRQFFIDGQLEKIEDEICQLPPDKLALYFDHYLDEILEATDLAIGQEQTERLIWKFFNSFTRFDREMYVECYLQLADYAYQHKQYLQGIHYSKKALQANLHHPTTFTYLGKGYYYLQMHQDALHSLDTGITLSQLMNCETSIQYHYRGMVHVALKEKQKALSDMRKSFTIEPVYKTYADMLTNLNQIISNPKNY